MTDAEHELSFGVFGSQARILVGVDPDSCERDPRLTSLACAESMRRMHSILTRFEPESELSRLNRDPRPTVPVSPLLMRLLEAAVHAAELTNGLVDATVLPALLSAGYRASLMDVPSEPLEAALAAAPERIAALPSSRAAWREIELDREGMTVSRPVGLQIDPGGVAKGLAADLCSRRLDGFTSFAVDCAGDIRIGGTAGAAREVNVANPFDGGSELSMGVVRGAVATSGISSRAWRRNGVVAHHLIDPLRARPAWTGIVQATAFAPTAVEAEARAKAAFLAGPDGARRWLKPWGGAFIDDGARVAELRALESVA